MKAERRHELQENILAGWLAKQVAAVKPYWQVITGVAIVAVLGLAAFLFLRGRWNEEKAVGWVDYFDAVANRDIDKLEEVADKNPEAIAGLWALQAAGDERLLDGTKRLYSNPAGAKLELHKAVDNYESVLERTEDPMLVRRALFGLARAQESLDELDEALKRYSELVEKFPDTPVGTVAKRRIEFLSRPSTKEFLSWLSTQDFEAARMTPPAGGGGGMPPFGAGGTMPPFGAGGGMPAPGRPGSSSREDESLMDLPDFSDPMGIGGAAAGQPGTETPGPETPLPEGSAPDAGEATDDDAESTDAPSTTPATEDATTEETRTEPEPTGSGEPTEEPAGDAAPVESSAPSPESTPEKTGGASQPDESGSENE